jgi:hypothetical protein
MKLLIAVIGAYLGVALALAPPAKSKFEYVDLESHGNQKLTDNFANVPKDNCLPISKGEQTLQKIKFKIGDSVIQLGSKALPDKPDKVEGIKVDKTCVRMHILHAASYGGGPNLPGAVLFVPDDTSLGEYQIHYEDESVETVPIVYGKDVRDWWFRPTEAETSRGKVAWKGDNDYARSFNCRLRLYMTSWKNTKPDKKIVSIDYISQKQETTVAPFCVAITLEGK